MSSDEQNEEDVIPFLSFSSLREAHKELITLKRESDEDDKEAQEALWSTVVTFLERGEAAGAYLDDENDRESAQNLLDYWNNQLFHVRHEAPESILFDYDPSTQPEIPDSRCPYVGLESFTEKNDQSIYFLIRPKLLPTTSRVIRDHLLSLIRSTPRKK